MSQQLRLPENASSRRKPKSIGEYTSSLLLTVYLYIVLKYCVGIKFKIFPSFSISLNLFRISVELLQRIIRLPFFSVLKLSGSFE